MNNQAFIDGQNLKVSTMNAEPSWTVDLKRSCLDDPAMKKKLALKKQKRK